MGLKSILTTMVAIAARDPAQLQTWRRGYTLGPVPNRYKPHQGAKECARRVRQGNNGTGGPLHLRDRPHLYDFAPARCRCRECIAGTVAGKRYANECTQIMRRQNPEEPHWFRFSMPDEVAGGAP